MVTIVSVFYVRYALEAVWSENHFYLIMYWLSICGCETLHLGTLVTLLLSLFIRLGEVVGLRDSWESVNWEATETEIELFCCVTVRNEYLIYNPVRGVTIIRYIRDVADCKSVDN